METASTIEPINQTNERSEAPITNQPTQRKSPERKLTLRQQAFINEYIKTDNATQSAITAGYSANSARCIAHQTLKLPYIKSRIAAILREATNETILSVIERKQLLSEIARGRLGNYIDKNANIGMDEEGKNSAALSKYMTRKRVDKAGGVTTTKEVQLHDPMAAISELNKMEQVYLTAPQIVAPITINYVLATKDNVQQLEKGIRESQDKIVTSEMLLGDGEKHEQDEQGNSTHSGDEGEQA